MGQTRKRSHGNQQVSNWPASMIRLLRLFSVLGFLGTGAIWIWTYYPTELAWIGGSRVAGVRVYLFDGLVSAHVFRNDAPRPPGAKSVFEAKPFVQTYPYRLRPVVGSFETSTRTSWGIQTRHTKLEVVWGFVFVVLGVVPFSLFALLPFLRARRRPLTTEESAGPQVPQESIPAR